MTRYLSDRELLELAAMTLGYSTTHKLNRERQEMDPPVAALVVLKNGDFVSSAWNPLEDDGHAFRLMVALKLDVEFLGCEMHCGNESEVNADQQVAARRVIVRAASALGLQLLESTKTSSMTSLQKPVS